MAQLFFNNAYGFLAQAINETDTSIILEGAHGLPSGLSGDDFFLMTLYNSAGQYGSDHEVVKVTDVTDNGDGTWALTVERGHELAAVAHVVGEPVEARLTAGSVTAIKALANTKVPEAPNDGKQYARQDSAWSEVQTSSVLSQTLTAPAEVGEQGNYEIQASATSLLSGGSIASFVVTWWDNTAETVTATAGEATLSKAVDIPAGGSVSATVYAVDNLGNRSATETVSADVVNIYIATPSITSPANGATDIPEQPVIELSAFNVVNGSTAQASATVRIKDSTGTVVWELTKTSDMQSFVVDAGVLQEGENTYSIEAKQTGNEYGASDWSPAISITTSASFIPDFEAEIGAPYGGGFVAGKIVSDYDGQTYGLIVSDGSGDSVQMGDGTMNWRTSRTSVTTTEGTPPMTLADGRANHNAILALNSLTEFPAFKWIEDNCNTGAGLNGHTDWYLPSRDELEIIYRNFKPTTQDNNDGTRTTSGFGGDGATHGTNANSIPEGTGYTLSDPAQTTDANFQAAGTDAFEANYYWSSTENSADLAWVQVFNNGGQGYNTKDDSTRVRAVRRIAL